MRASVGAAVLVAACTPASPPSDAGRVALRAVMLAEDRRAGAPADLDLLRAATADDDARVRAVAARGIGRLERAELIADLVPLLEDEEPAVRAAAAFGTGQAADAATVDEVAMPLYLALSRDPDETVRAAAAHALGRLPYPTDELVVDAWQALYRSTQPPAGGHGISGARPASPTMIVGVLRGMEALARAHREATPVDDDSAAWLAALLRTSEGAPMGDRQRPLAVAILSASRRLTDDDARAGLNAPDVETRRRSAAAIAAIDQAALRAALQDPSGAVRTAALQALRETEARCEAAAASLQDPWPHARIVAISLLVGCPDAAPTLAAIAGRLRGGGGDWHEPAAALLALGSDGRDGSVARQELREPIEIAAAHPVWQVRAYAARAAGTSALWTLRTLAADSMPNVRQAAIERLGQLDEPAADVAMAALYNSDDPWLLMTAAAALAGSTVEGALEALAEALARLDARAAMTDRDARAALLERIAELAPPGPSSLLADHLDDHDPAIAELAATLQAERTGGTVEAEPSTIGGLPYPETAELERLARARVLVRMSRGGTFELRLLPYEAPTNAARFARMVQGGVFDGLTFHRVVANFVIQGGSPGANEYAGHGAYTRDEITDRSHLRGTVGISTRGRDTGDGQIFVNLVDNYRLDGDYTIFAEVVDGMEVVDAVREGDAILSAELIDAP